MGSSCGLAELAHAIGAELRGDAACRIDGVASLERAEPHQISFLTPERFRSQKQRALLATTRAGALILDRTAAAVYSGNALVMTAPYLGYARATQLLRPFHFEPGLHPASVVSERAQVDPTAWIGANSVIQDDAVIAAGVFIGPGCVVGAGCRVGEGSRLVANATLLGGAIIGKRAIVHAGAVVGDDGFGLAQEGARWIKIEQLGGVVLGDDVEIGSNTVIDRGALDDTVIGDGVKLDNLVQVAHNVHIGEHTAIAALTGISGSVRIGRRCTVAGEVGIAGHLEIGDDVHLTGKAMVIRSIREPGRYSSGIPASPNREWRKNAAQFRRLDELRRRVVELERRIMTRTGEGE